MKNILIAVDFSEFSLNAARFGCALANDINANVVLLHSFNLPLNLSEEALPVLTYDEVKTIAAIKINQLQQELQQEFSNLTIETKIAYGEMSDTMIEMLNSSSFQLSILGNSGVGNSMLWLGSNVAKALTQIKSNTLAIPEHCAYEKPSKILFACDFKHIKDESYDLNKLMELVNLFGTQLYVIHVDNTETDFDPNCISENMMLHDRLADINPKYFYLDKEQVDEGIIAFASEHEIDWIAVAPHQHSFFERLFSHSHTKTMIKLSTKPLLAIH